jgi:hypothetical protein
MQGFKYRELKMHVLCACETWYLTLNEEHSLRLFDSRVLRRMFVPKKEEVTGE